MTHSLEKYAKEAQELDLRDHLARFREKFVLPSGPDVLYLCSNSLGLPPVDAFTQMEKLLRKWSQYGAKGWFQGDTNWYTSLDKPLREPLSHLLGAKYDEVIAMNSLTVNLHLLFVSFYNPTKQRYKILIEAPAFPSDFYAIKSQIRFHNLDPEEVLIILSPRDGEHTLRREDIEQVIENEGKSIAIVFLSSVNFFTGQVLDMAHITKKAKEKGCLVGYDIAHAAGNIPLHLHAWEVDFAVGCSYKFLCSGPGGPGIAYVHESHHKKDLPRLAGWWGNDPSTRFQMHLQPEFVPYGGAYGWQVSTPSILALTPLAVSLGIFAEAGIANLRKKSELQTAFLLKLLGQLPKERFEVVTPNDPSQRGGQLSLLIHHNSKEFLKKLEELKVICDFRPPNIVRVTPSPLYNTFNEILQFVKRFASAL